MNQIMQNNLGYGASRYSVIDLAGVVAAGDHMKRSDGRMPHTGRRERRRNRNNRH